MGYTTQFKGEFDMSETPTADTIIKLRELEDADGRKEYRSQGAPDSYNQWELSKDCRHVKWNGGEKFYNYVEWLQWIIDNVLSPVGIELSGTVQYSGEEMGDVGTLSIVDGKVIQTKTELVLEEMKELVKFKNFVLSSDYKDEILERWLRFKDGP